MKDKRIAVLLPCYNEVVVIAKVIQDFRGVLPEAAIYVYDNGSTDDTANIAQEAGAIVCFVQKRGKGRVVQRMFADIEADVYVLVDGDATYDAFSCKRMISALIDEKQDMVVAKRVHSDRAAY
ncbi:MAG: glycosyltransferase [Holosporales bacterium]|jgi:glycosyltransferase involved in cell wall biosynthesis|nr:glycosyltransferase [Holosporales bacterium]